MDVVTVYLYGLLDIDIYMKVLDGLKLLEAYDSKSRDIFYKIAKVALWFKTICGCM